MPGPIPSTDREYIIKIFEQVSALGEDYRKSCDSIFDQFAVYDETLRKHDTRITELEKVDASLAGFVRGEEKWWLTYKDFVVALVSIVSGVMLAWAGLK
jgi:hypothetical protein